MNIRDMGTIRSDIFNAINVVIALAERQVCAAASYQSCTEECAEKFRHTTPSN